jgi:hypothetical protein
MAVRAAVPVADFLVLSIGSQINIALPFTLSFLVFNAGKDPKEEEERRFDF